MTAIDEADKLAPCWFCRSEPQFRVVSAAWEGSTLFCQRCEYEEGRKVSVWAKQSESAAEAWNRQVKEHEQDALNGLQARGWTVLPPNAPEAAAQALRERGWTVVEPGESLDPPLTQEDLRRMVRDPRWKNRDAEYTKKVTDGFRKLFGIPAARPEDAAP